MENFGKVNSSNSEDWFGLKDEELRLRKRYLDMLANSEVKEMFYKKSVFWSSMREFLAGKGFLEVETPVLETTTGSGRATFRFSSQCA